MHFGGAPKRHCSLTEILILGNHHEVVLGGVIPNSGIIRVR